MKTVMIKWLSGKKEGHVQSMTVPNKYREGDVVAAATSGHRFQIIKEIGEKK